MNGVPVNLHMMLDDNGTAFFLEGVDSDDEDDDNRTGENPRFYRNFDPYFPNTYTQLANSCSN